MSGLPDTFLSTCIPAVLNNVTVSPASPTINIDQQASITLSCEVDANRDATIEWTSNVRTGVVLASGTGLSLNLTQNTADLAHQEELTCTATLGNTTVSDMVAVTTYSELSDILQRCMDERIADCWSI